MKGLNLFRRILNAKTLSVGLIVAIASFLISNYDLSFRSLNFKQNTKVIEGKVVKIIDGDTLELLDTNKNSYRIRLYGIDAPENKQAYGKKLKNI